MIGDSTVSRETGELDFAIMVKTDGINIVQ